MAKLRGTTYRELDEILGKRESIKIGNNTVAIRASDESQAILIRLHESIIVDLYPNNSVGFCMHGYDTVTTRERINQFLKKRVRLYRRNKEPYICDRFATYKINKYDFYLFRNGRMINSDDAEFIGYHKEL